jgi:hypothetical protein
MTLGMDALTLVMGKLATVPSKRLQKQVDKEISPVGYGPGAAGKEALITAVHESHGEISAATGQGGFDLSSGRGLCYGNFGGGGIGNAAHSGRRAGGQLYVNTV